MNRALPPFVSTKLLTARFDPARRSGRAYLSREHRPYICYGISGVSFNVARGLSLRSAPDGAGLPALPFGAFVTLVEWGSMDQRLSRIPWPCTDPAANDFPSKVGNFAAFPVFTCAPFLVDLSASYIDIPDFASKSVVACVEVALTPADAANITAAGLRPPAVSTLPGNRLSR